MNCWVPTLKAPLGHPACVYAPLTGSKDVREFFLVGGIWRDGVVFKEVVGLLWGVSTFFSFLGLTDFVWAGLWNQK